MNSLTEVATLKRKLTKISGVLGIIGGIALAAAYVTHPTSAPPETVASGAWLWIHIGFMLSLLSGVFLLIALLDRYLENGGTGRGVIGFAFAITSLIFVFGLDYSEVFIFPVLAVEFPEVVIRYGDGTSMPSVAFAFPVTGIVFLIGFVLFAWELLQSNTISRQTGYLTIVGTIIFAVGLSGLFPMIVVRVGSVIFGAALIAQGTELIRQSKSITSEHR